jgi:hypothetical protein
MKLGSVSYKRPHQSSKLPLFRFFSRYKFLPLNARFSYPVSLIIGRSCYLSWSALSLTHPSERYQSSASMMTSMVNYFASFITTRSADSATTFWPSLYAVTAALVVPIILIHWQTFQCLDICYSLQTCPYPVPTQHLKVYRINQPFLIDQWFLNSMSWCIMTKLHYQATNCSHLLLD